MFAFFKNILRRSHREETAAEELAAQSRAPMQSGYSPSAGNGGGHDSYRNPKANNQAGRGVELSLQTILEGLPLELQPRVRQPEVGALSINVPLEKILAQLSRGSVRISFGELRHAAPGVFSNESDRDKVMVTLPLSEIVPRLNPALIQRRRVQRQVEVPTDISSPFDHFGEGRVFSAGPGKPPTADTPQPPQLPSPRRVEAPAVPPTPAPATAPGRLSFALSPNKAEAPAAVTPAAPAAPIRGPMLSPRTPPPAPPSGPIVTPAAPAPVAPVVPKAVPQMKVVPPAAPGKPATGPQLKLVSSPSQAKPAAAPQMRVVPPAAPAAPSPAAQLKVVPPASPAYAGNGRGSAEVPSQPAAPADTAPKPTPPTVPPATRPEVERLLVGLSAVAEAWPDNVRREIVENRLVDAKLGLPIDSVEQSLKQGRIAFSWKSLRGWVVGAPPVPSSPHDSMVLELPLRVVAPIFLERQKQTAKPQQKVTVDEDIPNLFFGFPQPDAPVGAGATQQDTNYYVWNDTSDVANVDLSGEKRGPGTRFVSKYATPNEVVSRAANMDGVAGALIALPDGLMVASKLAPDLNGETIAAFLPHIFGKVSQCTKELRMGELNNLNFTVGNVPWKIFRVNAIYFAVFGRAGEPLPSAQLASLAAELDHKPR